MVYLKDPYFPIPDGFQFRNVSWVQLSPSGNEIYFLQRGLPTVSIWDLKGNHLQNWNTRELGSPHSLSFQVLSDGSYHIWITDMAPPSMTGNLCGHCLKKFDIEGNYLGSVGICGENTQGTGIDPVQFDKVTDIAFDSEGYLWVTDGDINGLNNRVLQINPSTQEVLQVWSAPDNNYGSGPKEFHLPHAIDIDVFDRVWIADALNNRIQIIQTDGTFLQELKCFDSNGVYGVCVRKAPVGDSFQLFVSTSPTTSPTGGTIKIFDVAQGNLPVPNDCIAEFQWDISLPEGSSEGMLHMIDATPAGDQVFLATLGGDLAPQKWVKVYTPD